MERKLEEYRRRKDREKFLQRFVTFWQNLFRPAKEKTEDEEEEEIPLTERQHNLSQPLEDVLEEDEDEEDTLSDQSPPIAIDDDILEDSDKPLSMFRYVLYCLSLIIWGILLVVFIKYGFGTVYFVFSILFGMYFLGTSNRQRIPGQPSAYSVFNPNCEAIDGTLTGQQFEREMGYRM